MPWGPVPSTKTKKIWINPCSDGLTPMYEALELCKNKLEDWVFDKQDSFPPMVFNITDGIPTDIADMDLSEISIYRAKNGEIIVILNVVS